MTKRSSKRPLRPQERRILEIARSGLLSVDIVHRAIFGEGHVEAARSALTRLVQTGDLRSEPLDARRVHYPLTKAGSRRISGSKDYARSLKKQSKVHRYAVTWFIYADRPGQRVLLNPADYPEQFPVAGHRLPRGPFFLDRTAGRPRLGIILVDHNAHHRRMAGKCVLMLARFLRHGWFDVMLRQDAFLVAILTFAEDRKKTFQRNVSRAIAEQLAHPLSQLRPDLAGQVPPLVEVHVIPQLDAIVDHSAKRNHQP